MVTDAQVRLAMRLIKQGKSWSKAALKADLDPRTLKRYLGLGRMPSASRRPRTWRTRPDPFDPDHMNWAFDALRKAPELEAVALFERLCELYPDRYHEGQLRTFQRRVERWRATEGPDQDVVFAQVHRPGEAAQTDFTCTTRLGVTIAGTPAPPMLCHTVLPYSNAESATVCHSESMLAIRAGVQRAMFGWGRTPAWHQTDNSTSATHRIGDARGAQGERTFNNDYLALMKHLGMKPRTIEIGASEQNGDVEASNGTLKRSLMQHLLLRDSRDFATVEAWQAFVDDVIERRNRRRQKRFLEEFAVMTPLTVAPAPEYSEFDARVTNGSVLHVKYNAYSVPSRLREKRVRVRMFEGHVEVWFGGVKQLELPRLIGRGQQTIDYRHLIWSLVKKPGAFARYRYRDALFPTPTFRAAFDALEAALGSGTRTDLEYLRLLHLAASTMESDVEAALEVLMADGKAPRLDDVRMLVAPVPQAQSDLGIGTPNLHDYDQLLSGGAR